MLDCAFADFTDSVIYVLDTYLTLPHLTLPDI